MRILLCFIALYCFTTSPLAAQNNPPWRQPLMIARSANGQQFAPPVAFQDSSGVPSAVIWKGDTLVCVFQWFRQPQNSPTWDRVAVKFSPDKGKSWSTPVPVQIQNFPANFQRPFDPTLAVLPDGRLRMYFSSSLGIPPMGLDSSINTYSAVSTDGIHYLFEPGARVDQPDNRVIDPAVIFFNNSWHYVAPIGAPQQGAYHYVSPDGLEYTPVPNIGSDPVRSWTGNFVVLNPNELRFYGSGNAGIWYRQSVNGGVWTGAVSTNLQGGDPSVVKLDKADFLIIYVGQPYTTPTAETPAVSDGFEVTLNTHGTRLYIHPLDPAQPEGVYELYTIEGRLLGTASFSGDASVDTSSISESILILKIRWKEQVFVQRVFVKKR